MAAVSGVFLTSRYMAAYQSSGADAAFQIITAVIIGGASLKGGRGSVIGTFLGLIPAIFIQTYTLHIPQWPLVVIL